MTIPASGALAASTIATEFSHATGPGSNIKLSEFIRNNNASYPNISSYVADITANAPIPQSTSGLSFSKYYSSQKGTIHRQTISADTTAYNQFSSAGGAIPIDSHVVINSGIFIYSTSTGTPAYTTGSAPGGSKLYLVNNGVISGKGGAGGNGTATATVGSAGGLAATFAAPTSVNNASGTIGGGGGGGGGGNNQNYPYDPVPDGPPGGINEYAGGGGGGGAGKSGGAGGAAGVMNAGPATGGSSGSWNTGGAGGAGGYGGTYAGGAGGVAGAAGAQGLGSGTAGGAAGAATSGAPTYVTWISVGTRSGTVG